MKDIPLKIALVCWTSKRLGGRDHVRVIEWPDPHSTLPGAFTDGACLGNWQWMTTATQLHYLFTLFVELTAKEKIDPKIVADAYNVIPEFRAIFDDAERLQLPVTVGAAP